MQFGHGVLFYHNVRLVAIPTENTRSFLNDQRPKASFTIERLGNGQEALQALNESLSIASSSSQLEL